MSKTVSARIPNDIHKELCERCNKAGETISDFIEASIDLAMHGYSDFDFGDEEEPEIKNVPEAKITLVE